MKQTQLRVFILCLFASCSILGCKKVIVEESEAIIFEEPQVFTLTATYGSLDTKVELEEDGLGLLWTPGDCLYLIDVGTNKYKTVKMTTDITEPSRTASFKSETAVLSSNYIVLSGSDELPTYTYPSVCLSTNEKIKDQIILYGNLSVSDGQTSASITLKHVYAKLRFSFMNYPDNLTSTVLGMAVASDGIPFYGSIGSSGFDTGDNPWCTNISFTDVSNSNGISVLVVPNNYSGNEVIFYFYGEASNGSHVTYEIHKKGIELKAGINYNVEFDFSKATMSTITGNILNNPADFRAAAYMRIKSCSIGADIDFSDEVYIPINCNSIEGNNHILSNISVNYPKCDNIGLIARGYANNIALLNASVVGRNNVGAIAGHFSTAKDKEIKQLIVKGSSVRGKKSVGGLVGQFGVGYLSVSAFEGNIIGEERVGGIVGEATMVDSQIESVYSKGDVSGTDFVGGILGFCSSNGCGVLNSYHIGNVSGSGNNVGGISGGNNNTSRYCYSNGIVSSNYGISPNGIIDNCLTSSPSLSSSPDESDENCNYSASKTFLSGLSIINALEAFSVQVWPDISEQCPMLRWQSEALNGEIDIPGYGNVDW